MNAKRYLLSAALAVLLCAATQAQSLTRVTGTVRKADGTPVANARLEITKVIKGGVVVSTSPAVFRSNSSGVVEFDVLRDSTAYLFGPIVGFDRPGGVPVTIPNAATATLESLVPIASVPSSNLSAHAAVKASAGQLGHVRVGSGLAIDSDGILSATGGGGGGGVSDHGLLTGLSDDDHTQYLNQARGDARYYTEAESDALIAANSSGDRARANHTGTQAISTVSGLQSALDAKAASAHTHTLTDVTDEGTAASRNVPASGNASAAEVVLGSDTRLSDARAPTTHTHTLSQVTDAGTASALNVPAAGDAAAGEVVKGSDSRLTNARTPTGHTHTLADVTDEGALAAKNAVATGDINNDAVTYAKLQDVSAASKLLGRGDSGTGDVQEITLGTGLSMSGTTLSATGGGGGNIASINGDTTAAQTIAGADDISVATSAGTTTVRRAADTATGNYWMPAESIPGTVTGTVSASANRVYVTRVRLNRRQTFNSVAFRVSTASAGGFAAVGLYSNDGATKHLDSGAVSTGTTGVKTAALGSAVTLPPGWYLAAWTADNTTAQLSGVTPGSTTYFDLLNAGTSVVNGHATNTSTAGALPATLGTLTAGTTTPALMKVY